ncbi:DUF4157 domain-containing protein [Pandoraea sputorum]|uniref:eCIS core domain-containing protein n=1 Tax=Pandoraea sputorum TaxID=93222 RepID=UPI002F41AA24
MRTYSDSGKDEEHRTQAASQGRDEAQATDAPLTDNRPSTAALRQLQTIARHSPRAVQLKSLQGLTAGGTSADSAAQREARPNNTGIPDGLKSGIESLSGMSMDAVKVHYNSSQPAQLDAHAYAQGTDIHLAPGQEQHLPHEAWHIVQQAQGRVQPTMQLHAAQINDDPALEREADRMGALAMGQGQAPSSTLREVTSGARVLQGNFPDAVNDARRGAQVIEKDDVQLDHMVSQESWRTFSETLTKTLAPMTMDGSSRWADLGAALAAFRTEANKTAGAHVVLSEQHLINIPENIVPGRANQVQGAKNFFDPEMSGKGATVQETAFSLEMRKLDDAIRQINQLVVHDFLPTKVADSKKATHHDSGVEDHLVALLKEATAQMVKLNAAPISSYTKEHWYQFDGSWVKKRGATWLTRESDEAADIGQDDVEEQDDWADLEFTFIVKSMTRVGARPTLVNVPVMVTASVPSETWSHIFKRHYLPTFAWDIQAVNTFWKQDPFTYLDSAAGRTLLQTELTSLLKKTFNFSKSLDLVEDHEMDYDDWSQADSTLFFQADVDSEFLAAAAPPKPAKRYEVKIDIKSIAPQSDTLAYAMTPTDLRALKPQAQPGGA